MSLLQQLSSAALDAMAGQIDSTSTDPSAKQDPNSTAQVHSLLQQLGSSIAAIRDKQQQQRKQQQQQGEVRAVHSSSGTCKATCAGKFVRDVQSGLQASNEQLQRLLSQHGGALPISRQAPAAAAPAAAAAAAAAAQQVGSNPPSIAVLQKLLQLAVGDSCCSPTPPGQPGANSSSSSSRAYGVPAVVGQELQGPGVLQAAAAAAQQQQWQQAAWEAVQLFSFQELEQLPPHSLEQALLLRPELLIHLLESAAAAVLQPILQHTPDNSAGAGAGKAQQPNAPSSSSSSSSSGSVENMQSLLSSACSWMQSLPAMLAHNPLLLLKASSTLLSWFEASGHTRLWQLLSVTCRPAWQQLAAAAAAATDTATVTAREGQLANSSSSSSNSVQQQQQQLVLAGSLRLLCPQLWQRQLVGLLAQEPSESGLLMMLRQLPGVAVHQQQQQQADCGSCMAADMQIDDAATSDTDGGGAGSAWSSEDLLAWPDPQEWGQPAAVQPTQGCGRAQGVTVQDRAQVMLAWGLVMQHRCWYQFACALLVRSSLHHLQQQQQQQDLSSATQQLQHQLQLPTEQLQGCKLPYSQPAAAAAAAAAAFIAWIHQPIDSGSQICLVCQLLSATTTAGTSCSILQQPRVRPHEAASALLAAWRTSLQQQQQQQQPGDSAVVAAEAGASVCAGTNTGWTSPTLFERDLPCAVLQQKPLNCKPEELVGLCITVAKAPNTGPQQQQQQLDGPGTAVRLSRAVPVAALCQLLDCSNDVCAAALEVVNLTVRHKLQQQQQQQQKGTSSDDLSGMSWLAKQWLSNEGPGSSVGFVDQTVVVPDLAVAKQLLAAATGVDQHLKQCAKVHTGVPL